MAENSTPYRWIKLADSAAWSASYNFQMIAFRDTLWVFHAEGNWYSPDGIHWTKSVLPNAAGDLTFLDYFVFNNEFMCLGHAEGDILDYTFRSVVSKTSDMKTWSVITETNLPKIVYYHPFVFQNKLWIIGGDDGRSALSDIWYSEDAIHWTKHIDPAPFGKRSGSQFVIFKESIILIDNDVWISQDGIHWVQLAKELFPGEIIYGHHALVYDDQIWLLGYNRDGNDLNETLMSADGKNWKSISAPWAPRDGVAACVFQNKIFLTGGKYGGWPVSSGVVLFNDVWIMEKNWPLYPLKGT